jgi:APA family basic amino acid/polyamine antiporter
LAGALPRTGGVFVYLREAFGPVPAFLFGWAELTVIRGSALGAIAVVFAEYFLRMLGIADVDAVHYTAAITILIVAGLNSVGINIAALVQNVTATSNYLALVALVLASFLLAACRS